jgi:pimeloyl-ACP methyl ester carboxylesterase
MRAGPRGMRLTYGLLDRLPPRLFRALVRRTRAKASRSSVEETEQRLVHNAQRLGSGDQRILRIPPARRTYAETAVESYRQGVQANVEEALLLGRRWPFRVDEITFERIFLWHGEQDRIMPVAPARQFAQALPHCQTTFYPDTGHLSTVVAHADDIVGALSG